MRTVASLLVLIISTPILAMMLLLGSVLGIKDRPGSVYDWVPRLWSRLLLWAAGVRVILHHPERAPRDEPRIYVSNHVSWFDVFTLAATLRYYKFVAKAELFRIPLWGPATRAAGMIPIERENRKSAFESFDVAASRIRAGASVVVCPEGTRGRDYALRPFKKGPFVLAAAAGVPIVPTVLYGTIHVQPRGGWRIRSGTVHVHFLEEIPTAGTTYADRDALARACWQRMADTLEREYGIHSVAEERPIRTLAASKESASRQAQ